MGGRVLRYLGYHLAEIRVCGSWNIIAQKIRQAQLNFFDGTTAKPFCHYKAFLAPSAKPFWVPLQSLSGAAGQLRPQTGQNRPRLIQKGTR